MYMQPDSPFWQALEHLLAIITRSYDTICGGKLMKSVQELTDLSQMMLTLPTCVI